MAGHRPFSDLMKDWSPERRARNEARKAELAAEFERRERAASALGRILDKVPNRPPEPGDELPEGWTPDRLRDG